MTAAPQTCIGRFHETIERIDRENAGDPRSIVVENGLVPLELHYARRVTHWVRRLDPSAPETLLLAARSQHIGRWRVPRDTYPMTRAGYLNWRTDLKQLHAAKSTTILRESGYSEAVIDRVRALNLKQGLSSDPEVQTLEDALCLVTLELQLDDLIARTDEQKMLGILQKTWRKMSPAARQLALKLPLSRQAGSLLAEALGNPCIR